MLVETIQNGIPFFFHQNVVQSDCKDSRWRSIDLCDAFLMMNRIDVIFFLSFNTYNNIHVVVELLIQVS